MPNRRAEDNGLGFSPGLHYQESVHFFFRPPWGWQAASSPRKIFSANVWLGFRSNGTLYLDACRFWNMVACPTRTSTRFKNLDCHTDSFFFRHQSTRLLELRKLHFWLLLENAPILCDHHSRIFPELKFSLSSSRARSAFCLSARSKISKI